MIRTVTYDDSTHKIVPKEPTKDMLSAAWEYHGSIRYSGHVRPDSETDAECYHAMIVAAPEFQEPTKDEP